MERADGEGLKTLSCIEDGWNKGMEEKENEAMHKYTDSPHELYCSVPPLYAAIPRATAWRGGDAKRRGVRSRESNHLLHHSPFRIYLKFILFS
jgi:hypothetical protein